ncbi:MAG: DUF1573 domain-containing protein [Opitutales bacterium]|nr:DUF1573 domain-containing protein [Opitutales bacterium]
MLRRLFSTIFFCLTIFCSTALAVLEFERDRIELDAGWDDQSVDVAFPFENTGSKPIRIQNVRTSCGCTAATPEKRVYQPGESGSISANFTVGNRQGVQRNRITVQTDEASYGLEMVVNVPVAWQLRNRVLVWREHEKSQTRSAELVVHDPSIVVVDLHTPSDSAWTVSIQRPSADEPVWLIEATPEFYESQRRESLGLRMIREDGSEINGSLFLRMF